MELEALGKLANKGVQVCGLVVLAKQRNAVIVGNQWSKLGWAMLRHPSAQALFESQMRERELGDAMFGNRMYELDIDQKLAEVLGSRPKIGVGCKPVWWPPEGDALGPKWEKGVKLSKVSPIQKENLLAWHMAYRQHALSPQVHNSK